MDSANIFSICLSAFIAVFVLLFLLAVIMRITIRVFPGGEEKDDTALFAALSVAVTAVYPGTRTTRIKEVT